MINHEQLMHTFQQGDTEALARIYEQLHPILYAFLFRYTRDEQLSVDLVQDTFEQLQKSKHTFDSQKGSLKSFIFQIGYRFMINKLNRRKKWRTLLPFLTPLASNEPSADDTMTVQHAVQCLPDKQRAVIILSYYHDLPHEEIARILDIPKGTVKSRLHHAIITLKQLLREDFHE